MKWLVLECLALLTLINTLVKSPDLGPAVADGLGALTVLMVAAIAATAIVIIIAERRP